MGREARAADGVWALPGAKVEEVSLDGRGFLVVSYDCQGGRKMWVFEETPKARLPLALRREIRSEMPADKAVLAFIMGRDGFHDEESFLRRRIQMIDRLYLKAQEEVVRLRGEIGRLTGKKRRGGTHAGRNP